MRILNHFLGGPKDGAVEPPEIPPSGLTSTMLFPNPDQVDLWALYLIFKVSKKDDGLHQHFEYAGSWSKEDAKEIADRHSTQIHDQIRKDFEKG